ncbi:MAG TPA: alcohol dehydrogenase catalytic domain-containing protein [Polyangiaceae bacterium]
MVFVRALRVSSRHGDKVTLEDIPEPRADGEVIVRVAMSGICNTDLEIARGYAGFQGTIGHEFVGTTEDGRRVVGEINAGCGACDLCARGDPRHCRARTVLGIVGRDGAHADYLRLPAKNLLPVPDGVSDVRAVFVEPLAAACGVLERCPAAKGARVCVIGDGKLGLLCAMVLAANGNAPLVVGKHDRKLGIARRKGIETSSIADAKKRGRAFDVVVEASGSASGFDLALDLLEPQGTLVLKSTFHGASPVEAARVVVDEITVVGSRCGRFAPALDLLARGAIDTDPFVSEIVSLDRGVDAMSLAAKDGVMKVLLAENA